MEECGVDLSGHQSKVFEDMHDDYFSLIVALSPEAQHHAVELTRTMACDVEFWNTFDPTIIEGGREEKRNAYRMVRDQIRQRLIKKFGQPPE